jgi:hypothetical protein
MTQEHTEKLPQDNLSFVDIIHQIAGQLEELRRHGYGSIQVEIMMDRGGITYSDVGIRRRYKHTHQIKQKT